VRECAVRLARYLQSLGPCQSNEAGDEGLNLLGMSLNRLTGDQSVIKVALQGMVDRCLFDARWEISSESLAMAGCLQEASLQTLHLVADLYNYEDHEIVAAWEAPHWRYAYLQNYLSCFTALQLLQGCLDTEMAHPDIMQNHQSLPEMAVGGWPIAYHARLVIRRFLLLRLLQARLQGAPLPADPFSSLGRPLQIHTTDGWQTIFSIGPGASARNPETHWGLIGACSEPEFHPSPTVAVPRP
jgi:hypothetical protein